MPNKITHAIAGSGFHIFLLHFILLPFTGLCNDGAFYAQGSTLFPIKETTISLKKEILNLTRLVRDTMQVDIHFEFYNPGEEKELIVGFVTPPASGGAEQYRQKHPHISRFMVMVNDRLLEYKVTRMDSTGFSVPGNKITGRDFIYYFTVRFKKGITVIKHSYVYKASGSVEMSPTFDYRLTTGNMWANSSIESFELNINMGNDCYFFLPHSLTKDGKAMDWKITGTGRIAEKPHSSTCMITNRNRAGW